MPRAHAAHPAVWKVTKGASTVYLFGTIHALPPHFEWETGAIKSAIAQSDRLVIEAVIDQDPNKSAQALLRLGTATTKLPPIADRVSPKFRPKLAAMMARSQLPDATLDGLKTWAAGMVLFGPSIAKLGVSSADGVEEQLKAEFRAAGKPIEGLETLDQQLGFFDTLTEPQQRDFLESVLDEQGDDASDFGKMIGAWSHGDEKGIAASFDKDMKKSDALRTVLIARRDAHWADAIVARLAHAGHAAGRGRRGASGGQRFGAGGAGEARVCRDAGGVIFFFFVIPADAGTHRRGADSQTSRR